MLTFSAIRSSNCAQLLSICRILKTRLQHKSCFASASSINELSRQNQNRCYSNDADRKFKTETNNNDNTITDSEIKKSVYISQSNDIFRNLALEDWLYRSFDFKRHHVLLLWVNDPCVVIGRHQNPFTEANVSKLVDMGIPLARRSSGGGAVYHDRGNLNCTFFTPKQRYNRKYNLNILTRALFREWAIKAEINQRDDITLNNMKISGTAAKLGHPNAYHHCTLLVDANKLHLGEALIRENANYTSKATPSVRSSIKNLCDVNRSVNISQLLTAVGYEFLRTSATELEDGGCTQAMKQRGFQLVNPTEKWFPGIDQIREEFSSWDWVIGKTPNFVVEKDLAIKGDDDKQVKMKISVEVEKGLMTDIKIVMPSGERLPVVSQFQRQPYNEKYLNGILKALKLVTTDSVKHAINSM